LVEAKIKTKQSDGASKKSLFAVRKGRPHEKRGRRGPEKRLFVWVLARTWHKKKAPMRVEGGRRRRSLGLLSRTEEGEGGTPVDLHGEKKRHTHQHTTPTKKKNTKEKKKKKKKPNPPHTTQTQATTHHNRRRRRAFQGRAKRCRSGMGLAEQTSSPRERKKKPKGIRWGRIRREEIAKAISLFGSLKSRAQRVVKKKKPRTIPRRRIALYRVELPWKFQRR